MLPALTGAAMLHTSDKSYAGKLKQAMSFFGSTSPSYLIMASLDLCTEYISENIKKDIAESVELLKNFRRQFEKRLIFADGDPFHITVMANECGRNGKELAQLLRENGAECEYADDSLLIILMSPADRKENYERLADAMEKALSAAKEYPPVYENFSMTLPKKAMSVREAAFAPSETIPTEKAEGRICAAIKVPCPPAVPIAASGEIIDGNCINIFRRYGISEVNVVLL
jgi:arginine/lysine/ornithine decarboxylase